MDLLSLPTAIMKPSSKLDHKYQMTDDVMTEHQTEMAMEAFRRIFEKSRSVYKHISFQVMELLTMHIQIFKIIENLHDLMCIGSKDYKVALSTVQDYNMTKLVAAKCAIPDKSGEFKKARCDIDTIKNVFMDIGLFNFVDMILAKYKQGSLSTFVQEKEKQVVTEQN